VGILWALLGYLKAWACIWCAVRRIGNTVEKSHRRPSDKSLSNQIAISFGQILCESTVSSIRMMLGISISERERQIRFIPIGSFVGQR
jgi:hypothetical protein